MTLGQTALAVYQQAGEDGLKFVGYAPLEVEGPEAICDQWAAVLGHLRERAERHPARPDLSAALATAAKVELPPNQRRLLGRLREPNRPVWVDGVTPGRLEALLPTAALVTLEPEELPADPVERWTARTARAAPVSPGRIEPDPLDQVIADGYARLMRFTARTPLGRRSR